MLGVWFDYSCAIVGYSEYLYIFCVELFVFIMRKFVRIYFGIIVMNNKIT